MLTKDDLQAIQQIVKMEVKKEIKDGLAVGLKEIKKNIASLKTDMRCVKSDVRTLKQDVSYISREFDGHIIDTIRRVDRIEDHLRLPPLQAN